MRVVHVTVILASLVSSACGSAAGVAPDVGPQGDAPTASPGEGSGAGGGDRGGGGVTTGGAATGPRPAPDPGNPSSAPAPGLHADGPPYPIVLMHGMAGFDALTLPVHLTYFDGVQKDLASRGETQVYVTVAPPFDTSEERAQAIAPQIAKILADTGKAKVNLIGHSQGGMDARVLASPNGMGLGDRIASVTTVATPHQGSRAADLVLGLVQGVPPQVLDAVTGALLSLVQKTAYDVQSDPHLRAQLTELSERYMTATFNPTFVDDPRVLYASYGGRTNFEDGRADCVSSAYPDDPTLLDAASPELLPLAIFLERGKHVTNDGLVTIASARWGTFMQCVPADHLQEVGMILREGTDPLSHFDHVALFRTIVTRLREEGL